MVSPAVACGPGFPNQLLFNSGQSLTWAPVADFQHEIDRLIPTPAELRALPPGRNVDVYQQTADRDLADLREVVSTTTASGMQRREVIDSYAELRQQLTKYAKAVAEPRDGTTPPPGLPADVKVPPRLATVLKIPPGLPAEFDAYVRGVISYDNHRMDEARKSWQAVLDLPAAGRKYRGVWAQFMIGKSYLGEDPAKAVAAFQLVRDRVKRGERDSLGLAAASFGWEAKAQLQQHHQVQAISLYLTQRATGDETAVQSLAIVCEQAFASKDPKALSTLAADAAAARVMTAYVLSHGNPYRTGPSADKTAAWLAAMETAGTTQMVGADRMAWSAYQAGDMKLAQRWVDRAADGAPMALWIRAKLLLRAGKTDAAAKVLAQAVHAFPVEETWTGAPGAYEPLGRFGEFKPGDRAAAELGALDLARGQYVESLDRLLKAGWWLDAAYVAERVLTTAELTVYVDRNCPEGTHPELRHLLARRLTRDGQWKEARPYYPQKLRPRLDAYIAAIRQGHDQKLKAKERADGFWTAAKIARHEGMQLLGTELTPDDFADDGNYDGSNVFEERQQSKDKLLPPLADELNRAAASAPHPDKRWHYRYIAADHAWSAAELMPDESDALAQLLCEAGGWLKARDPNAATRFYEALVSRCGSTALGRAAREKKWFPETPPAAK
jgi:hypothetical protein